MSETVRWSSNQPRRQEPRGDGTNLADILERVLDKGIVIAGDIQVNLLDIELLTIKIRLVVASVDRAKEMGIDWWERDPTLSAGRADLEQENARLRDRIEVLERSTLSGGRTDGYRTDDDPADEYPTDEDGAAGHSDEPDDAADEPEDHVDQPDDAEAAAGDPADEPDEPGDRAPGRRSSTGRGTRAGARRPAGSRSPAREGGRRARGR